MNNLVKWTTNTPRPHKKTDIKRVLHVFFKNDFKELREVKLLGKATLHMVFHILTIRTKV